jgi:hypothetical protein
MMAWMMDEGHPQGAPYRTLAAELRERHGQRVQRVCLHGGFTCPNRDGTTATGGCTFCSLEALVPPWYRPGMTIAQQLEAGMAASRRRYGAERFVAYFQDASTTHVKPSTLATLWAPALAAPEVVALAVSTRPDCVPEPVLDQLHGARQHKDLWLELGLQIADDAILSKLNRGHAVAAFTAAVTAARPRGIPVCAHIIIGLPGATPELELRTADLLAELGVWGVKLHGFHVVRGTEMARRWRRGELALLTEDEHVERVARCIDRLPAGTVIHRVTGEAPSAHLLAPAWTIHKHRVISKIRNRVRALRALQSPAHPCVTGQAVV